MVFFDKTIRVVAHYITKVGVLLITSPEQINVVSTAGYLDKRWELWRRGTTPHLHTLQKDMSKIRVNGNFVKFAECEMKSVRL